MIVLYHADTAVCAAKVRVVLAEKNLGFESRLVQLHLGEQFTPEYMKLNPNAVVPTLVHDDAVITESGVINEYIDEVFPQPSLRPADAALRAKMRIWTKKEDSIHDAINTMTATMIFRHDLLQKSPAEQEARFASMPDPARRIKWRRMLDEGLSSSIVDEALMRFARHFRDMEKALAKGPWLTGENFTLADAGLLSFFYRLEMLQCAGLWREHFPAVSDWYERAKQRPSFAKAITGMIPPGAHEKYAAIAGPLWPQVDAGFRKALAV